jgi:perosamine synthetase
MLALAALGIGPGDEVILPDLTYFACSDVIVQLGATPVFVDVDVETWCIDPEEVKKAITPKTKAIMPVWMYGNAPDMNAIMEIASDYDLDVVEDACPAVGSYYASKHAGSFGNFGCFSFHGAKIMTTGFGGMVVTNNKDSYDYLCYLADHGEDKTLPFRFWQSSVGYSFDMSNVSAAMGLAQLERIDDFVDKKHQIFRWYQNNLENVGGLLLNKELPLGFSNMWLYSIILDYNFGVSRNDLIIKLKERGIDTRPFFFPISDFPMYHNKPTLVSHFLSYNGLNLPSGVQRTGEDIDFICKNIKEILNVA